MVEPHLMEYCRVQVVDVYALIHRLETEIIGSPMYVPGLETTTTTR